MNKRVQAIRWTDRSVLVKYQVEVETENGDLAWLPNTLQGDSWFADNEMSELTQLFLARTGSAFDPENAEIKGLTWRYPKEGPEVCLSLEVSADRVPDPMTLVIGGIAIAAAGEEGGNQFTTAREAELLTIIADKGLKATKTIFQNQNRQLELLDGGAEAA